MAQNDYVIDNAAGAVVRADLNALFQAIVTWNKGTGAPSPTYADMVWIDAAGGLVKRRNSANTGWVVIAAWDGTTWIPYRAGTALGTAAILTAGTGANNAVQLDANARLPALDMRNLTGPKLTAKEETGTAYTLTETDRGQLIRCNNAGAITVTLPETATEDLIDGFNCTVVQWGVGQVTFATEGSDVIRSKSSQVKTSGQYAAVAVTKITDGEYYLTGSLGS